MYKICVFGGTTEGRELVEFLNAQPCEVTACVATEYGQALLPEAERLTVSARRLPADEIKALLTDRQFDLVIDATHPYAASITKSIARACAETGVERWRLLRGASDAPEDAVLSKAPKKRSNFESNRGEHPAHHREQGIESMQSDQGLCGARLCARAAAGGLARALP